MLSVIAVILAVAALKTLSIITIPIAVGLFVAMLLYPVQERVNRALPDGLSWLGTAAAMLVFVSALTLFAVMISLTVSTMAANLYRHAGGAAYYWNIFLRWAADNRLPVTGDILQHGGMVPGAVKLLTAGITSAWMLGGMLLVVFFLVLLMLGEADRRRKAACDEAGRLEYQGVVAVVGRISRRVRLFLLVRTAVSVATGVLGGLWLWFVGTDYAFSWGVLIFLLNYIPYLGSIAAVFPPTLLTFVLYGPGKAALALAGLTLLNQVTGNYIDPRLEGRIFTISPTVVFVSVLFWGWLWGAAGALLAVPINIALMTVYSQMNARKAEGAAPEKP